MKIIITGVAGFVGSNLAKRLIRENHTVVGIDNFSFGNTGNLQEIIKNPGFQFLERDVRNEKVFEGIKADVIVHLASQKIPRYTNALVTLEDNYLMLKNVIKKAVGDKIKIVFSSTSDVYGKNPNIPYNEESDLVLGKTTVKRWAYALSKIYSEHYILANHDEHDLEYTIMRFFGSYGPNQNLTWWGGPQSVFIGNALQNKPIEIHGDGLQTRTFTYVDDTIEGVYRCITHENSKNEIFNVANNPEEEINILELGRLCWKLVNGENSEPLINFIPYQTFGNYEDVRRRVPDISKIKKMLDYDPKVNLKEGLIKTIDWQKKIMSL
jgi:UDP-glucose 4-epimerase